MKQKTVALCIAGKNNIKHKMNIDTLYIYHIWKKFQTNGKNLHCTLHNKTKIECRCKVILYCFYTFLNNQSI